MKKTLLLVLFAMVVLVVAGCKRTTDENIYDGTPDLTETTPIETLTETADDAEDDNEEAVKPVEDENASEEDQTEGSDQADATVTEDVYDNENASQVVDHEDVEVVSLPESIDDPEFRASLLTFFDPIYYNIYFGHGDYVEGITQDDMIKFAVSYIYQHEYNELKFDTTDFILYVPEKRVEDIVVRYFDTQVNRHHSFIDDNLMYEDGFYLMPAVDTGWDEKLAVKRVTPTGDFSYDVTLELIYEGEPESAFYHMASVEVRDNRFVLVSYVKVAKDSQSTEEHSEEASEE